MTSYYDNWRRSQTVAFTHTQCSTGKYLFLSFLFPPPRSLLSSAAAAHSQPTLTLSSHPPHTHTASLLPPTKQRRTPVSRTFSSTRRHYDCYCSCCCRLLHSGLPERKAPEAHRTGTAARWNFDYGALIFLSLFFFLFFLSAGASDYLSEGVSGGVRVRACACRVGGDGALESLLTARCENFEGFVLCCC